MLKHLYIFTVSQGNIFLNVVVSIQEKNTSTKSPYTYYKTSVQTRQIVYLPLPFVACLPRVLVDTKVALLPISAALA